MGVRGDGYAVLVNELWVSDQDPSTVNVGARAEAGECCELGGGSQDKRFVFGLQLDCSCNGVFAAALDGGRQPQHLGAGEPERGRSSGRR